METHDQFNDILMKMMRLHEISTEIMTKDDLVGDHFIVDAAKFKEQYEKLIDSVETFAKRRFPAKEDYRWRAIYRQINDMKLLQTLEPKENYQFFEFSDDFRFKKKKRA